MKSTILSFVVLFLIVSAGNAQQRQAEYSGSLSDINVIVLNLPGNSTLVFSGSSNLKINSFLFPRGGVLGWQSPSKRPDFKITDRQSADTLYVAAPPKFTPNSVGFSNYAETMNNIILLPADKKLIISNADNLKIEGRCKWIDINQAETVSLSLEEFFIRELSCIAQKSLIINDSALSKAFVLKNTGSDTLYIKASHININLKEDI
jgi:hypothetical protein